MMTSLVVYNNEEQGFFLEDCSNIAHVSSLEPKSQEISPARFPLSQSNSSNVTHQRL